MLKKTITYTDYNGVERTEDFYFNLTKAELHDMDLSTPGGLTDKINRIASTNNAPEFIEIYKNLIFKSYGVKSDDGRRFIKSEELSTEFLQTEAYSVLYMELLSSVEALTDFMNGVLPVPNTNVASASN